MRDQTWVLLRGLVRERRHWEGFPERLAAAMPESRIVALDLPGNGSRCHEASPLALQGMVASARADLRAQGIDGPYSLLALSLGAMTAFEWMSSHPGEVGRAVLANTSLAALSPVWDRLRPANYLRLVRDGLLGRDRLRRERMILEITTNLIADRESVARRWAAWAGETPTTTRNSLAQLLAAARYRAPEQAPRCPVLLLNGGGDRLVHPRCSDAIADAFGLPLERHATAGHDLALDDPGWLADRVVAFARRSG